MSDYFNLNEGVKEAKRRFPKFGSLHSKINRKILLIVLVAVIGIPITVLLSQQEQDTRQFASAPNESVLELSNALITEGKMKKSIDERGAVKTETVGLEIIAKAKKRKELMLKLAKENPEEFLLNALPERISKDFSPLVRENVEKEVELKGKYTVLHFDDFKNKKQKYVYQLQQFDNKNKLTKTYNLNFSGNVKNAISGSEVSIKGYSLDNELVVQGGGGGQTGVTLITPEKQSTTGDQKTLVILMNFQNDPTEMISKEAIKKVMFGPTNSVKDFYAENSYNKIKFIGDVVGYFTIPFDNIGCEISYDQWAYAVEAVAFANGVDVNAYPRHVFVFYGPDCVHAGWSTVGGNPSRAWIPGDPTYSYFLLGHELGHSLGSHHANAYECGDLSVREYKNECEAIEYADPADIMGYSSFQFNAPHKDEMGWLDSGQIKTINDSTSMTLSSLESNNTGVKVAQIPIPNSDEHYYLSYRQPIGYDSDLGSGSNGIKLGTNIHLWKKMNQLFDFSSEQTNLIDSSPNSESNDILDSALKDGSTFTDPYNGISVKQISHTDDSVNLEINIDKGVCRRGVPEVNVDPISQVLTAGTTGIYDVSIKNNDTPQCGPSIFNYSSYPSNARYSNEWYISFSTANTSINPGETVHLTESVRSSSNEPNGVVLLAGTISTDQPRHNARFASNYIIYNNLDHVNVSPGEININLGSQPVAMSALAYDYKYQPIKAEVDYEWSMGSADSVGRLEKTSGQVNKFIPIKSGSGELTVKATFKDVAVTRTVPVNVIDTLSPTPTKTPTPTPSPLPTPSPTPSTKTLNLTPTADAYVRKDNPTNNYGLLANIQTDSSPSTISFMKFNLSSLNGKKIVSAKLVLKVSQASSATQTLKRADEKTWSEKNINYNNKPSLVSTLRTFSAKPAGETIELDVKNPVNIKKGSILTLGITSGGSAITKFYSRESASSNRPQLIVEYQ